MKIEAFNHTEKRKVFVTLFSKTFKITGYDLGQQSLKTFCGFKASDFNVSMYNFFILTWSKEQDIC